MTRYLLHVAEGSGPLKSTFWLLKGNVAFTKFLVDTLQNLGFNSGQAAQKDTVFLTSSAENGRILGLTKYTKPTIPGWHRDICHSSRDIPDVEAQYPQERVSATMFSR